MSFFTPIRDVTRGLQAYPAGVRWLRKHPRYLAMLGLPALGSALFLALGIGLFVAYGDRLTAWVLFARPAADGAKLALYYAAEALLFVASFVVTMLASLLFMNVLAAPVYEQISIAVERDLTGREPPHLGFWGNLKTMLVELKKVGLILVFSILLLLIPGLNVISALSAAFLVGWDFFDYPVARRGWSLRRRLRLVAAEFWAVLGFGFWLIIPFAQVVMLPLAVAGGTLLNLDALQRHRLLTPQGPREVG